jgi:nitrogen fixation NifU-like protein
MLSNLYQEMILDHNNNPRNQGQLVNNTHTKIGHNPLCGDKIEVFLIVENEIIKDIKYASSGCAISTASASIMSLIAKGKSIQHIKELKDKIHKVFLKGVTSLSQEEIDSLPPKILALEGVSNFPARVKCASLAWHTLDCAFENNNQAYTDE